MCRGQGLVHGSQRKKTKERADSAILAAPTGLGIVPAAANERNMEMRHQLDPHQKIAVVVRLEQP